MDALKTNFEFLIEVSKKINTENILIIAIHGPFSSGKTTFANKIKDLIEEFKIPYYNMALDKYYKNFNLNLKRDVSEYDFDNPAAYDWNKMHSLLNQFQNSIKRNYLNNKIAINTYEYDFKTNTSIGPIKKTIEIPKIIIVEGIYALNLFNKKCFDLENLDPFSKKYPKELILNKNKYENFNNIKIRLKMRDREFLMKVRIDRDVKERGRNIKGSTL